MKMKMKCGLLACLTMLNAPDFDALKSHLLDKIDAGNQKAPTKVMVAQGFLGLTEGQIVAILRDVIDILFKVNGSVSLKTPTWQNAISKNMFNKLFVPITPSGEFVGTDGAMDLGQYDAAVTYDTQFASERKGMRRYMKSSSGEKTGHSTDELTMSETPSEVTLVGYYKEKGKTEPVKTEPIKISSYHIFVYHLMTTMRNDISSMAGIIDRKSRDGFANSMNVKAELEHIVELIAQLQTYLAIIEKFLKALEHVVSKPDTEREKHSLLDKLGDMYLYQSECKSSIEKGKEIISKFRSVV